METFISVFSELVWAIPLPLLLFGLLMFFCRWLFTLMVRGRRARPLFLFAAVLSTPLRELSHAAACILFWHRIESIRFFSPNDPAGEIGFVEHSYRRKSPVAVLGNFVYAMAPLVMGLALTWVTLVLCFRGAVLPLFADISGLGVNADSLFTLLEAAGVLLRSLFAGGFEGLLSHVAGALLLLAVALGVYLSPIELKDGFWGYFLYAALSAFFAFVVALFDVRIERLVLSSLRSVSAFAIALSFVLLVAMGVLLSLGFVAFLLDLVFGRGVREGNDADA